MTTASKAARTGWIVVGSISVAGLATFALDAATRPVPRAAPPADLAAGYQITPSESSIVRPPTVPAALARLADNEPVIGVKVKGKARAYRRKALARILDHVVNDVLGTVPVSVTYCDRTLCTKVFTGDGTDPLDLLVAAYRDGLILKARGRLYRQDTGAAADPKGGPLPYKTLPFEETTWGKWRAANPNTDVYLERPNFAEAPKSGGG